MKTCSCLSDSLGLDRLYIGKLARYFVRCQAVVQGSDQEKKTKQVKVSLKKALRLSQTVVIVSVVFMSFGQQKSMHRTNFHFYSMQNGHNKNYAFRGLNKQFQKLTG